MNNDLKRVLSLILSLIIISLIITISLNLVVFLLPFAIVLIIACYIYKLYKNNKKSNHNVTEAEILEEKFDK